MRSIFLILTTFLLFSCNNQNGKITVEVTTFEQPGFDIDLNDGEPQLTGGAIIVGNSFDEIIGTSAIILYRVNSSGAIQGFQEVHNDLLHPQICVQSNDQLAIVGTEYIDSAGSKAITAIMIQNEIDQLSRLTTIEADHNLFPIDLIATPEEELIILHREQESYKISWPRITKISSDGKHLLDKEYRNAIEDSISSSPEQIIYSEGMYYVLCSNRTNASTAVLALDENFNIRRVASFSWDGWNFGTSFGAISKKKGFIMTTTSYQDHGIEESGLHLVRLSRTLKKLWDEHIPCERSNAKVLVTESDRAVVTALSESKDQLLIYVYSIDGEREQEHTIDLERRLEIRDMIELQFEEIMILGTLGNYEEELIGVAYTFSLD